MNIHPIGDENVGRLVSAAYKPEAIDPDFARSVEEKMVAAARRQADDSPAKAPAPTETADPRLRRVRRRLGWAMAVAACVAVVLLIRHAQNQPADRIEPGELSQDYVWDGSLHDAGLRPRARPAAEPEKPVAVGATIKTGAGERRRVTLGDGSVLFVNQNSEIRYTASRQVDLKAGAIYVEVSPQSEPRPSGSAATFTVKAPRREITALGTHFAAQADPRGDGVFVSQGKVKVSGLERELVAGEQLAPGSDLVEAAPRASHLLDWTRDLMIAADSPLVPCPKHGGGALIAVDPSGQEVNLALRKFHIDVHIEDGFARTTIDQTYFNNNWSRLEGTFYFPLPPDASLSRLAMYVEENGQCRLMEGGMAERDHARDVYETIRHARRDPALLEWVDGSTFKMRVFPLEGRKEKRILLSYTQRLSSLYGVARYRFPAGHNMEDVRDWSFAARVKHAAEARVTSDSHPAMKIAPDLGDMVLAVADKHVKPNKDVTIDISGLGGPLPNGRGSDKAARFSTFTQDGHQYLMLRYRPSLNDADSEIANQKSKVPNRSWVFLFESSADRDPLLARTQIDVIKGLLEHVEHDDTFAVVTANSRVHLFDKKLRPATDKNIAEAIAFLESSHLIGALDLDQALASALALCKDAKNPHLIHVGAGFGIASLTTEGDGNSPLATLGRGVGGEGGVRYVGIGVGKRFNRSFMKNAAERTGGHFTQINPDEPVAWRAFDLFATLSMPRLHKIQVGSDNRGQDFLLMDELLSDGEELCAIARFPAKAELPRSLRIRGELGGKKFEKALDVADAQAEAGYLPRTWAKLEIDRLLADGPAKNKAAITELSKAMYVMTPFTSLLVLETDEDYKKYNVDRGRKDHWAMYPAPDRIPIVYEAGDNEAKAPEKKREETRVERALKTIMLSSGRDTAYESHARRVKEETVQREMLLGRALVDFERDLLALLNELKRGGEGDKRRAVVLERIFQSSKSMSISVQFDGLEKFIKGQRGLEALAGSDTVVNAGPRLEKLTNRVQQALNSYRDLGRERSEDADIYFPPLPTWAAIRDLRKEKYDPTDLINAMTGANERGENAKLLQERIDMKDFQEEMTLREALDLFAKKLAAKGKELPILIDTNAFKKENPDAPDIYDTRVRFQPHPKTMALATALRLALSQVPTNNATYLIRRNYLEVTTNEKQVRQKVMRVYPTSDLIIPLDTQIANSIEFNPPSLALIVKDTIEFYPPSFGINVKDPSRLHYSMTGGIIGGKQKRILGAWWDAREKGLDVIMPEAAVRLADMEAARAFAEEMRARYERELFLFRKSASSQADLTEAERKWRSAAADYLGQSLARFDAGWVPSMNRANAGLTDLRRGLWFFKNGSTAQFTPGQLTAILDGQDLINPSMPMTDSGIANLGNKIDAIRLKRLVDNWGRIPERERALALQTVTKDLPPRYREAVTNYFRVIAQNGTPKGNDPMPIVVTGIAERGPIRQRLEALIREQQVVQMLTELRKTAPNAEVTEMTAKLIREMELRPSSQKVRRYRFGGIEPEFWVDNDWDFTWSHAFEKQSTLDWPNVKTFTKRLSQNLTLHAPGLHTTMADVYATVQRELAMQDFAAEANLLATGVRQSAGLIPSFADVILTAVLSSAKDKRDGSLTHVPQEVRDLFDKARNHGGWQAITIPADGILPAYQFYFNNRGQFAYERLLDTGLRETVVCDGSEIVTLYPEIGLGSRRAFSRFHHELLADIVPWALPAAEVLAMDYDLKRIAPGKIALLARGGDKDQPQVHLHFAEDGRLTERRLVVPQPQSLSPSGARQERRVLLRHLYDADGTVKLLDGAGKVLSEEKFALAGAQAPNLTPDTKDLLVIRLPVRTSGGGPEAEFVRECMDGAGVKAVDTFGKEFHMKGDTRIGFYTLLFSSGFGEDVRIGYRASDRERRSANVMRDHPDNPLAYYLSVRADEKAMDTVHEDISRFPGGKDGFIGRLATFRHLVRLWKAGDPATESAGRDTHPPEQWRRALAFVQKSPSSLFSWILLQAMAAQDNAPPDADFHVAFGEAFKTTGERLGLDYAGRYEHGVHLGLAGRKHEAATSLSGLYDEAFQAGELPPIDLRFIRTLDDDTPGGFRRFMREKHAKLLKDKRPHTAVYFAWQLYDLGETVLADEVLSATLASAAAKEKSFVALTALEYLCETQQFARADEVMQTALASPALADEPGLWRLAAAIAWQNESTVRAVLAEERALDLEYRNLPEVVNLETLRQEYGTMLDHFQEAVDSQWPQLLPRDLLVRVVRTADRWRALDPENTDVCQKTAKILRALGAKELAWDYLTTPLAMKPNEAEPWVKLAEHLAKESERALADKAYAQAFAAEATNAQILWDRAKNLEQLGRMAESRQLLRELSERTWQPRFDAIRQQARQALENRQ